MTFDSVPTTVPYISVLYALCSSFYCAFHFIKKEKRRSWTCRVDPKRNKLAVFSIHWPELRSYCAEASASDGECVNDAAAVTLHVSLFLVHQPWPTEVHLSVFIKGRRLPLSDEVIINAGHDFMCELDSFGFLQCFVCMRCFFFLHIKHIKAFLNAQWKQNCSLEKMNLN